MERQLLTAEKLGALAGWLGSPADPAAILAAWEPVLFNETHDLASGVMTDHVYEDTVRSYEYVEPPGRRADRSPRMGRARARDRHPRAGSAGGRLQPAGMAALGHRRGRGRLRRSGASRASTVTGSRRPGRCPCQIVESTRYADGGLKTARVAFIARDVPRSAMRPITSRREGAGPPRRSPSPRRRRGEEASLENDLYRVTIDPATGAITSLRVKPATGRCSRAAATSWRGSKTAATLGALQGPRRRQPDRHDDQAAGAQAGPGGLQRRGKERAGNRSEAAGLLRVSRGAPVRLRQVRDDDPALRGLRRIEVTTRLVNNEKYVRYQALFPTTIQGGKNDSRDPLRRDRAARARSSSPPRTGWTTATAAAAWPCSISACPATS